MWPTACAIMTLQDLHILSPGGLNPNCIQGCYSETGFHIGMDGNFVCLWRRHNCRGQVIDLSLSVLIS